jgi:hypothetical protein
VCDGAKVPCEIDDAVLGPSHLGPSDPAPSHRRTLAPSHPV